MSSENFVSKSGLLFASENDYYNTEILDPQERLKDGGDTPSNFDFALLMQPTYNSVQKYGLSMTIGGFYSMNRNDTTLKPSSSLVHTFFTTNETWLVALIQEGFINKNNYWFKVLGVTGDWVYQYYQPSIIEAEAGTFVGYKSDFVQIDYNFLRKTVGDLYAGIQGRYSSYNTSFDGTAAGLPDNVNPNIKVNYNGLGAMLAFDTRDNILNAKAGINSNMKFTVFDDAIGSDRNFKTLQFEFQYFHSFNKKNVLATQFDLNQSFDDVPFEEQYILGMMGWKRNQPRGYNDGRYRGDNVYTIQTEWRRNIYRKFGVVLFGSVSIVGDDQKQIKENGLLPAIGAGARYLVIPERDINLGIDVATGKDDFGIYFTMSEYF